MAKARVRSGCRKEPGWSGSVIAEKRRSPGGLRLDFFVDTKGRLFFDQGHDSRVQIDLVFDDIIDIDVGGIITVVLHHQIK